MTAIRVIVAGAAGQTGGAVARAAEASKAHEFVVGVDRVVAMGGGDGLPSLRSVADAPEADVVIDFTVPDAAVEVADQAADRGFALVTGTTGLNDDQQAAIKKASEIIPVVQSGNYSLGVNLLMALVQQAAAKLPGFDVEVTEAHHRRKVDAPSGTALMLGEAAAHGRGTSLEERGLFTRHGQVGPRTDEEIGFSVIRGGGVFGDHDVAFMSDDEVITLSHRALSRTLFAQGALHAARWVVGKSPGLYSMRDVLELGAS